jgi:1,4-dihydroxy-2-naphthoyl-CoA synthase
MGTLAPSPTLNLDNVRYETKGAIAYVTVNRPKVLNALNTPTWTDLRRAFEQVRDDPAIRGAILTGAGDKAFTPARISVNSRKSPPSKPSTRVGSDRASSI